jgi:acyl carrier protein
MNSPKRIGRNELSDILCSTIALVCNKEVSEVSPDTLLGELNMDSLAFVSVLSHIEGIYDMEFNMDEVLDFMGADNIADLVDLVLPRLSRSEI